MLSRAAISRIALVAAGVASVATDQNLGSPPLVERVGPELALAEGEVTTAAVELVIEEGVGTSWSLSVWVRSGQRVLAHPDFRVRIYDGASGASLYDEVADEHFYSHARVCDDVPGCDAQLELELDLDSAPRASVEWGARLSADQGVAELGEVTLTLESP